MKRSFLTLSGLLFLTGLPVSAQAYEIDPLTREPLAPLVSVQRPQASAIPREIVTYTGPSSPGTIVVSTKERRLYYVLSNGKAIRYGIGVGRPGFEWGGIKNVTQKREWPDWRPPAQMLKRRPDLPRYMAGGPNNPLGARAMYLGSTLYRIHGSNEPETIGQAVSSGCIRMSNEDVTDLYDRVKVGARVHVVR
jgi:lipoprotein-anchoring transpeptidase ErfK/SrfK